MFLVRKRHLFRNSQGDCFDLAGRALSWLSGYSTEGHAAGGAPWKPRFFQYSSPAAELDAEEVL